MMQPNRVIWSNYEFYINIYFKKNDLLIKNKNMNQNASTDLVTFVSFN